MSTHSAHKGYELHRAVVQSADPVTGVTQVKIPDLLGNHVVDVHWAGLENAGGTFKTPIPGDMSLVAVSNDGTQIMWVLSADHTPLWNGIQQADLAIADLTADLAVVAAGVVTNTADIAALQAAVTVLEFDTVLLSASAVSAAASISTLNSSVVKTVTGTANEIEATRTGASVGLAFPTNVVKSGTGYLRVTNTGVSATAASVSRLEMGVSGTSPRIVFEDSTNGTVWVADNFGGTFRLFNAGTERYNLTNTALTTTGSINVVAGGTVQGTRLISTVATGTAPLTVTSTTNVANLNADQLDGCHIVTSTTAPTISTNPGLGTGSTHTANWMYIGPTTTGAIGMLSLHGVITLGTGPTMGDLRITLPGSYTVPNAVAGLTRVGTVGYKIAGAAYTGVIRTESSSIMRFIAINPGASVAVYAQDTALTTAIPATWAASDTIAYNIHCQVVYP